MSDTESEQPVIQTGFSTESLLEKIHFVSAFLEEPELRVVLNENWASTVTDYRILIRRFLEQKCSSYFSRQQQVLLNDLNWLPESETGYLSISHCKAMGGFSYSALKHGFDVEEMKRIAIDVLKRTCTDQEFASCPRAEFLWVAKEAGVKALSGNFGYMRSTMPLLVTDLRCFGWESHYENKVFSFRLKSHRTLDLQHNKGFIFSEDDKLFCLYFQ